MELEAAGISSRVDLAVDLSASFAHYSLPCRILDKMRSLTPLSASHNVAFGNYLNAKRDVLADHLCARRLSVLLRSIRRPSMFIGLNSMSLESGLLAREHGVTYVLHSQWSHPNVQYAELSREYDRLGLSSVPLSRHRLDRQRKEFAVADLVWCASVRVRDSLIDNGVDASKLITVPFGIDLEHFQCGLVERTAHSRFSILMVGSLVIGKGIHILLEAVLRSRVEDAELVLNGSPDAVSAGIIRKYQTSLAARQIKISVGPSDPRSNFQKASVFVLASVDDSFGLVVLEAMAMGLPVIVSSGVGAKECIEEGGNGVVFPSRDIESLAEHLNRFYGDRQLCLKYGRRSLDIIRQYDVCIRSEELMQRLAESMDGRDGSSGC